MKKIYLLVAMLAIGSIVSNAQTLTLYDANRLMNKDLNGSARFVGMGGAMSALGGDITTAGTNPAGIAIFRSNDLMTSFSIRNTSVGLGSDNTNKLNASFDNIGFVLANKTSDNSTLRYMNFAFNYCKFKNFNNTTDFTQDLNGLSQTDQIAKMTKGLYQKTYFDILNGKYNPYLDENIAFLSAMGIRSGLIEYDYDKSEVSTDSHGGTNPPALDKNGHQLYDNNGNPLYSTLDLYSGFGLKPIASYYSKEKGGIDEFDFSIAFNLSDQFYLGTTIGAYSVDYQRHSNYTEKSEGGYYNLENWFKTDGAGVDFKLGMIVRPITSSSFRIGASINSPIFYVLKNYTSARLNFNGKVIDTYGEYGDDVISKYQLNTPWKFNLSLGYVIDKVVALGAEYEYSDYSAAQYRDENGEKLLDQTQSIKDGLKHVDVIRLGSEFRISPMFAFRLGYNYISPSTYSNTYNNLPMNTTRTDTEYANIKSINNYTLGVGYKGSAFYTDIAYQYSSYKSDFYAFDDANLKPANLKTNNQQVLITLGYRF